MLINCKTWREGKDGYTSPRPSVLSQHTHAEQISVQDSPTCRRSQKGATYEYKYLLYQQCCSSKETMGACVLRVVVYSRPKTSLKGLIMPKICTNFRTQTRMSCIAGTQQSARFGHMFQLHKAQYLKLPSHNKQTNKKKKPNFQDHLQLQIRSNFRTVN